MRIFKKIQSNQDSGHTILVTCESSVTNLRFYYLIAQVSIKSPKSRHKIMMIMSREREVGELVASASEGLGSARGQCLRGREGATPGGERKSAQVSICSGISVGQLPLPSPRGPDTKLGVCWGIRLGQHIL